MDSCSTCGAAVQRFITLGGRIVDLETRAHDDGQYVIEWTDGHCRTRVLTGAQMPSQHAPAFRRHECPPVERKGPLCGICWQPMPREIATLLNWKTHPGCDTIGDHHPRPNRRKPNAAQVRPRGAARTPDRETTERMLDLDRVQDPE